MIKNTGFDLKREQAEQDGTEWPLGSVPSCIAEIPEEQRAKYLPAGERQNIGNEKMDCATRGPVNILETKFDYLFNRQLLSFENEYWLRENGYVDDGVKFSDRFISILSGTTSQGNSMKAPLDAIRKNGLIPKSMFPQVESFEEYYDASKITQKMKDLGKEFLKRFIINYEKVLEKDFGTLLHKDLLDVAGYAWPEPVNGEYPRSDNTANHVFVLYKTPKYYAFDNYIDFNNDFSKKLSSTFDFLGYGYRLLINNEVVTQKKNHISKKRYGFYN